MNKTVKKVLSGILSVLMILSCAFEIVGFSAGKVYASEISPLYDRLIEAYKSAYSAGYLAGAFASSSVGANMTKVQDMSEEGYLYNISLIMADIIKEESEEYNHNTFIRKAIKEKISGCGYSLNVYQGNFIDILLPVRGNYINNEEDRGYTSYQKGEWPSEFPFTEQLDFVVTISRTDVAAFLSAGYDIADMPDTLQTEIKFSFCAIPVGTNSDCYTTTETTGSGTNSTEETVTYFRNAGWYVNETFTSSLNYTDAPALSYAYEMTEYLSSESFVAFSNEYKAAGNTLENFEKTDVVDEYNKYYGIYGKLSDFEIFYLKNTVPYFAEAVKLMEECKAYLELLPESIDAQKYIDFVSSFDFQEIYALYKKDSVEAIGIKILMTVVEEYNLIADSLEGLSYSQIDNVISERKDYEKFIEVCEEYISENSEIIYAQDFLDFVNSEVFLTAYERYKEDNSSIASSDYEEIYFIAKKYIELTSSFTEFTESYISDNRDDKVLLYEFCLECVKLVEQNETYIEKDEYFSDELLNNVLIAFFPQLSSIFEKTAYGIINNVYSDIVFSAISETSDENAVVSMNLQELYELSGIDTALTFNGNFNAYFYNNAIDNTLKKAGINVSPSALATYLENCENAASYTDFIAALKQAEDDWTFFDKNSDGIFSASDFSEFSWNITDYESFTKVTSDLFSAILPLMKIMFAGYELEEKGLTDVLYFKTADGASVKYAFLTSEFSVYGDSEIDFRILGNSGYKDIWVSYFSGLGVSGTGEGDAVLSQQPFVNIDNIEEDSLTGKYFSDLLFMPLYCAANNIFGASGLEEDVFRTEISPEITYENISDLVDSVVFSSAGHIGIDVNDLTDVQMEISVLAESLQLFFEYINQDIINYDIEIADEENGNIYYGYYGNYDMVAPLLKYSSLNDKDYISGKELFSFEYADVSPIVSTELYISFDCGENWTLLAETDGGKLEYEFNSYCYPDGNITIKTIAFDIAGKKSNDNIYECVIENDVLAKPENLCVAEENFSSVTLRWNLCDSGKLSHYIIRQKDGDYFRTVGKTERDVFVVTGLQKCTEYVFCIAAVDIYGNISEFSEEIIAKTKDSAGSYIKEIALVYYKNKDEAVNTLKMACDYVLDYDLTEGTGGDYYVYMGWNYTTNPDEAITDLRLSVDEMYEKSRTVVADGKEIIFYPVNSGVHSSVPQLHSDGCVDLNKGAGGATIYLYATKDASAGAPIRDIVVSNEILSAENGYFYGVSSFTDKNSVVDVNKEAGGDYIYLYTRTKTDAADITSFTVESLPGKIKLNWAHSADLYPAGFEIYRKTENSSYKLISDITNANTHEYVDFDIIPEEQYQYKICSYGNGEHGEFYESEIVTGLIDSEPPAIVSADIPENKSRLFSDGIFRITVEDNCKVAEIKFYRSSDRQQSWEELCNNNGAYLYYKEIISDLSDGTYFYKVEAVDTTGNKYEEIYEYFIDFTGPDAPDNINVNNISFTGAVLTWDEASSVDTAYYVIEKKDGEEFTVVADNIVTTNYTVSSLVPDNQYIYRIKAVDIYGNEGPYSEDIVFVTNDDTPAKIEGFTATADIYKIKLDWTKSSEDHVTGYNIYRREVSENSFTLLKKVNSRDTVSFTDTSLVAGTTYVYQISAFTAFSEGEQAFAEATVLEDTVAPSLINISIAENTVLCGTKSITVTAKDNIDTELRYEFSVSDDDGLTWSVPVASEGTKGIFDFDTTVYDDGIVQVAVNVTDARNNVGRFVTTYTVDNTAPETITGLTVEDISYYEAELSWNAAIESDFSYYVLEKKDGDDFITVKSNLHSTVFAITDLEPDKEYIFRIKAVDKAGNCSLPSEEVIFSTLDDTPAAPESLTILSGTYKQSLSWLKSTEYFVTGYKIYRAEEDSDDYTLIKTINSRDTVSFVDSSLPAFAVYSYKISAFTKYSEGPLSEAVSAQVEDDTDGPRIITFVPVSYSVISSTKTISATAEDNIGVTKFVLSYSLDNGESWTEQCVVSSSKFSYSLNTKEFPDGEIQFRLTAFDAVGNESDPVIRIYQTDNTGPEKVTGIKVIEVYSSQATLAWNAVADSDANHFILRRKDGDKYTTVSSSISGSLGYHLTNLLPDTEYTYSVACVDHCGNVGEYSDDFTFRTKADTTAPVITSQSPSAGRYNNNINFRVTVSDDCAIKSITIQTSVDRIEWTDVNTVEYTDNSASKTYSYNVSLSNFSDGYIYIRGIATDKSGNVSDTGDKAPLIQYYVDKIPPAAPQNVEAIGGDGYIQIKWEASAETDISGYYVCRSESADGTFVRITGKLSTINHFDRNVTRGKVYYYKVLAADTSGNVGPMSGYVFSMALDDTVAPTINSISPGAMSAISNNNNKIGVLASDNNMLSSITVEYKIPGGTYKTLSQFNNIGEYSKLVNVSLPMNEFSHGDRVIVRAVCRDVAGFTSAYSNEVTYVIDTEAPGLTGLSAAAENGICTLTWNDLSESDLAGYKIYKSSNGGSYSSLGSRSASSSHKYSFKDSVSAGEYIYRIDCIDKTGNLKSYYSDKIIIKKAAQVTPVITGETYLECGVQEVFSAASSKADNEIVSYHWDFGDGTTSDRESYAKAYPTEGQYTVTLTIEDSDGNVANTAKTVTVTKREMLGIAKVRVVNEKGYSVSNAPVYFDLGEDNQQIVYTNSSGYASLTMSTGVHVVGAYKNGYLPVSNKLTVLANSTAEITLTMVEQDIITGEFEVHEMTFEEIVASGIDIKNPANQQIYEVTVTLIYGEEKIPVRYVRNNNEIISYTIGNSGGNSGGGSGGASSSKIWVPQFIPNEMNQEIIAVVEIPITASYLKQFYSANLHIVNNAAPGFEIVDCEASISVPDGLTVVQHTPISSVIDGQSSSTASWILRGDKAGSYSLTASFNGTLDNFNVPVSGTFKAEDPVVVYGPETVKLRIEVQEEIDEKLFFNVCLVNNRPVNVNRPRINVSNFVYNITEYYKKNLSSEGIPKEDIEAIENKFLRMGVISADGKATFFDVTDPEDNPVDVLAPGETLVYEFCVNKVTDYEGTAYFNRAIVECDDYYASSIEVVDMSAMPLSITEEQFIKEHIEFIASDSFKYADTEFPRRIAEGLKDSFEDDWYKFVELDYFTNYAEIVLADYILQKSTFEDLESKYLELFVTETTGMYANLAKVVMEDYLPSDTDLTVNKIADLLSGAKYDTATYKHLEKAFNDYGFSPEVLKNSNNLYYGWDVVSTIWQLGSGCIDSIQKTVTYLSAVYAYKESTNVYFKGILEETIGNLGTDAATLKEAISDFISTDSTADFIVRCGEEIIQTGTAIGAKSMIVIFKDVFLANVAKYASVALEKIALTIGYEKGSLGYNNFVNVGGAIVIGYELGIAVSKLIANTGNLNAVMSKLGYFCQLATALEEVLEQKKVDFLDDPNFENALYFDTAFKSFKNAWLTSAQLFAQYAKEKNDALAVKIFSRDKFKDDIADAVNRVTTIKQLYCHHANHYVDTTSSKIIMVECPVDVYVHNSSGDLLAKVTDTETVINDNNVFALTYEGKKFVTMPSTDDYKIKIEAIDSGTMDYTVLEYSADNVNLRRVVFEDIELEKDDVFEGNIDSVLFTDKDNYKLLKNNCDEILPDAETIHNVTGVELDNEELTIVQNEDVSLEATVLPADAPDKTVKWVSLDESVVTVDETGVVTAVEPGDAIIKVITNDGGYVDYCEVKVLCANHTYDTGKVITENTCTESGITEYTCSVCGFCEEIEVPATGHTEKIINKADATCTVGGYTGDVVCEVCNETISLGEEIDANGHSYDSVVTVPTCTKDGYTTYTCSVCEDSYVADKVTASGHKEEIVKGSAPTCTAVGYSDGAVCSICSETIRAQSEIPAKGHKYNNIVYAPDCTEQGYTEYFCSVCGDYYTDNYISETGHIDSDGDNYCDVCGTGTGDNEQSNCSHLCHKSGFMGFIWKIVNFFNKLFRINDVCSCGAAHW